MGLSLSWRAFFFFSFFKTVGTQTTALGRELAEYGRVKFVLLANGVMHLTFITGVVESKFWMPGGPY